MGKDQSIIIRKTEAGIERIKTVLYWNHARGGEAHCLARLYLWQLTQRKAIVVISEIQSNPPGLDITNDFAGVVEALRQVFREDIENRLEDLVWVVHHGAFSYRETLDQETFTRVDVKWKGQVMKEDVSDWHLIKETEVEALLDGVVLQPVQEALKDLGCA